MPAGETTGSGNKGRLQSHILGSLPSSSTYKLCELGKLGNFSVPQFSHL